MEVGDICVKLEFFGVCVIDIDGYDFDVMCQVIVELYDGRLLIIFVYMLFFRGMSFLECCFLCFYYVCFKFEEECVEMNMVIVCEFGVVLVVYGEY